MTDYQYFTTKDMDVEDRRKLNVGDIWNNSVKCLSCMDIIRSKNRHDMVYCTCGKTFVDGGSWYQKTGGEDLGLIDTSLIEYYDKKE